MLLGMPGSDRQSARRAAHQFGIVLRVGRLLSAYDLRFLLLFPLSYKIIRWVRPPEVDPEFLRVPDPRLVCCVVPDVLHVTGEFDNIAIKVPEVFKLVVTR